MFFMNPQQHHVPLMARHWALLHGQGMGGSGRDGTDDALPAQDAELGTVEGAVVGDDGALPLGEGPPAPRLTDLVAAHHRSRWTRAIFHSATVHSWREQESPAREPAALGLGAMAWAKREQRSAPLVFARNSWESQTQRKHPPVGPGASPALQWESRGWFVVSEWDFGHTNTTHPEGWMRWLLLTHANTFPMMTE